MNNDDSAREIDALDCKTNPENFERLFSYVIASYATRMGVTRQQLYQRVAEAELRDVVRKAVDRFQPSNKSITLYASWWLRQLIHRRELETDMWRRHKGE